MGLRDDVLELAASKSGGAKYCKAIRVSDLLPEADRVAYAGLLADETFTSDDVADLLAKNGVQISASQVATHRRERCICRSAS